MINKDSILSVYTEKATLLEYLTAIEKALNNAVLVSADIVDEGSNKCHFVFTFEDGNKIVTPAIEFIKPVKGASIRGGVLYLVLADGTEVNAGSITASFGASTFNGDVLVKGTITQETFLVDKDIPVTFTDNAKGIISCYYAHARVSNEKLSLVFAFYMPANSVEQKTIPAYTSLLSGTNLTLPSSILSKLYPTPIGLLDIKSVQGQQNGYGTTGNLTLGITKGSTGLSFALQANSELLQGSSDFQNRIWRFEFNFTLS